MPVYQYRAATAGGALRTGSIDAGSEREAFAQLQRRGLRPVEASLAGENAKSGRTAPGKMRRGLSKPIGELAVLVSAGIAFDRALGIVIENVGAGPVAEAFERLQRQVREGVPLSRAVAAEGASFPPVAAPMIEAGEANGAPGVALTKLAETLERSEALRTAIVSAMIYPALLVTIAVAVILMMLLFVVPQFEGLFGDNADKLPAMTKLTVAASHAVKDWGLVALAALVVGGFLLRQWLRQPAMRRALDRRMLATPRLGHLIRAVETARFARVLGSLAGSGVPLPTALELAQRTIGNSHMRDAVGRVATGLKQGGGLSGPLAATKLFPRVAISFIRTGEETASLGPMLERLANVLDGEVKIALDRLVAILTPVITVVMGMIVATVIASLMTAILGFNNLALGQ